MQVDGVPDDDQVRETYNFAPGYYGAVYRAETPEHGQPGESDAAEQHEQHGDNSTRYKLQSMKWGLVPFWTKRQPDYGSLMRTINCRDDSLVEDRGMWTTMKRRKRCIVVCQGFYEWLKKGPGGKEKIPHFIRRKDGELMCFAGLWDCVSYEGKFPCRVLGSLCMSV
jgi:putative SOS response-associated peptidase YedK